MNVWIHRMIAERAGMAMENVVSNDGNCQLKECIRSVGGERLFDLLIDETKTLRPHINIFVGTVKIRNLETMISPDAEIQIFPALSGG